MTLMYSDKDMADATNVVQSINNIFYFYSFMITVG